MDVDDAGPNASTMTAREYFNNRSRHMWLLKVSPGQLKDELLEAAG